MLAMPSPAIYPLCALTACFMHGSCKLAMFGGSLSQVYSFDAAQGIPACNASPAIQFHAFNSSCGASDNVYIHSARSVLDSVSLQLRLRVSAIYKDLRNNMQKLWPDD